MKQLLLLLCSFLFSTTLFSQNLNFKEYSYSDLFNMIENEKDSVFSLSDALIRFGGSEDDIHSNYEDEYHRTDTIHIDKELQFTNVQFIPHTKIDSGFVRSGLFQIVFQKPVTMLGTLALSLEHCSFNQKFTLEAGNEVKIISEFLEGFRNYSEDAKSAFENPSPSQNNINITNCEFDNGVNIYINPWQLRGERIFSSISLYKCLFKGKENDNSIWSRGMFSFSITESEFESPYTFINSLHNEAVYLWNNRFEERVSIRLSSINTNQDYSLQENVFENHVWLMLDDIHSGSKIEWVDWERKIIDGSGFNIFIQELRKSENYKSLFERTNDRARFHDTIITKYLSDFRFSNESAFQAETQIRAKFNEFYKKQFDNKRANITYVELKDLQTDRMRYEFKEKRSFDNYFSFKINQFLKIFSAYGTRPSRAIVFSIYVILFFAFIYLFFPNSWDSHGKNRIINRYSFFMKYMRRKSGIHEVYMEEKKPELMAYEDFKKMIHESDQAVPKFFTATALPLYKWAISGTKLSSSFLKSVDVMKGSWEEVPTRQRWWKRILLIGSFLLALIYDLIIKMLNALMLSINTFTTLGFGEIPIKGLPRYLAIIQGFIGWFMLTIFSVSLISQLLT